MGSVRGGGVIAGGGLGGNEFSMGLEVAGGEELEGSEGFDWLACARAVAKALTLPKRCAGSFARAVRMTWSISGEIVVTFSRNEGGELRDADS